MNATSLLQQYEKYFKFSTKESAILYHYTNIIPIASVVTYLLMVAFLPKLLQKTVNPNSYAKPLKVIMIAWNLLLAILSIFMSIGIAVPYFYGVWKYGFTEGALCDSRNEMFQASSMEYWTHIFALSKFMELFDTLFLIVKKPDRPVPFLHWYHHSTVLLCTWYAEVYHYTVGYLFCIINSTIHSFMYTYYALTEMGYRPNWNKILTMCQISQMFVGIVVNLLWARVYFTHDNCHCLAPRAMLVMVSIMYGTYLLLFVQFFIKRYFGGKRSTTTNVKKSD
jgi:elongation of very long chain fatty acids protein 6